MQCEKENANGILENVFQDNSMPVKVPQHFSAYFDIYFTSNTKETKRHFRFFLLGMDRYRWSVYMDAKTIYINADRLSDIKKSMSKLPF